MLFDHAYTSAMYIVQAVYGRIIIGYYIFVDYMFMTDLHG